MILTSMLASAGIPIIGDLIKRIANKFIGPKSDPNALIRLAEAEVKKLEAIAKLDSVGNVSQWVDNIRGLLRPVSAMVIVSAFVGSIFIGAPEHVISLLGEISGAVLFYLFGERTVMHWNKKS